MAKGKKQNSYLKKAAKFATGQRKQKKGDKIDAAQEQTQQVRPMAGVLRQDSLLRHCVGRLLAERKRSKMLS